mgnify:CR=1 FL=1
MERERTPTELTRYANLIAQSAIIRAKEEEYYMRAKECTTERGKDRYIDMAITLGYQWIDLSAKTNELLCSFIKNPPLAD